MHPKYSIFKQVDIQYKDYEHVRIVKKMSEAKKNTGIEWLLFFIGIPISSFGYRTLQAEPVTHWFENLINPIIQLCGIVSLLIGVSLLFSPIIIRYGFNKNK